MRTVAATDAPVPEHREARYHGEELAAAAKSAVISDCRCLNTIFELSVSYNLAQGPRGPGDIEVFRPCVMSGDLRAMVAEAHAHDQPSAPIIRPSRCRC